MFSVSFDNVGQKWRYTPLMTHDDEKHGTESRQNVTKRAMRGAWGGHSPGRPTIKRRMTHDQMIRPSGRPLEETLLDAAALSSTT
jgi:hypothetical protein